MKTNPYLTEFQGKFTGKQKCCAPSKIGRGPCKSSMKTMVSLVKIIVFVGGIPVVLFVRILVFWFPIHLRICYLCRQYLCLMIASPFVISNITLFYRRCIYIYILFFFWLLALSHLQSRGSLQKCEFCLFSSFPRINWLTND